MHHFLSRKVDSKNIRRALSTIVVFIIFVLILNWILHDRELYEVCLSLYKEAVWEKVSAKVLVFLKITFCVVSSLFRDRPNTDVRFCDYDNSVVQLSD